jgi:pimeloyl-ACP methyl ester carboxylesterase
MFAFAQLAGTGLQGLRPYATRCGGYWFPDYLADLDELLHHLSPDAPVDLVGHSMGGNVALLYAGVRPHRVRRLVNLEGFGLKQAHANQAPGRYAEWLDQLRRPRRAPTYDNYPQLLRVLARRHPRIPPERLVFIARAWACEREDGLVELRADPSHRDVNPVLYQRDQAQACWHRIEAAVLLVSGELSEHARDMEKEISGGWLRQAASAMIAGAGHMLQHERPRELAELMESFQSD